MLKMLLRNSRVKKVGHMVSSDLRQLEETIESSEPFVGALDLASYAKERHVASNANCGLNDLCAVALQKRLNKNVSERQSTAWEQETLTAQQQQYAACDAYVPLLIYEKLSKLSVPCKLPEILVPLTPVLLYNTDNTTIIAKGQLLHKFDVKIFDGINITPTRMMIRVHEILVPGAIVPTHRKRVVKLGALQ